MRNSETQWGSGNRDRLKVGLKVVSLFFWERRFSCFYGWPSSRNSSTHSLLTLAGFPGGYYGNHFVRLFHLFLFCFLAPLCIAKGGVLHDRPLASVARDESHMA